VHRTFCSFRFLTAALLSVALAGSLRAQLTLEVNPSVLALSAQSGSTTPVTATITIASSGDSLNDHLNYATVNTGGTSGSTVWLTFTNGTGTTPGALTVSANPTGLADGSYPALILIYATGATNSPVNIPVTFTVGQLAAAPTSLNFTYQSGGSVPAAQAITITGPSASVGFTAAATVPSGSLWLEVAPNTGSTPGIVNVNLNPAVVATLPDGAYSGTIVVTPASGTSTPLNVPVTLTVSATPVVTAAPTSLAFLFETGGTHNTTAQTLALTSSGASTSFTAAASVNANSANVAWLSVSPLSGATPADLAVSVTPGALPAGIYSGKITITVPGAATVTVNVTLTVSTSPLLGLSPGSLTFTYQVGGALPVAQDVTPTSTGAALTYTAAAATTSGGSWLTVTGGGTTPNVSAVSVNPAQLAAGTYSGMVTFTATSAGNSPQQVPVTLTVTNNPLVEASPNPVIFLYQIGKTAPGSQSIAVTSSSGATLNYTVVASAALGWLSVTPTSGTTGGSLTVSVVSAGVMAGTYTGTIKITATNPAGVPVPNSPLTIPVTYYISENPLLLVSPNPLSFSATVGGIATEQSVLANSSGTTLNYTISSTTNSGGPWLAVSSTPGATPGSFPVSAVATSLSAGTYTGSITVTATNPAGQPVANSPVTIPVTLQVSVGTLAAAPASLAFTQVVGGAVPAPQSIAVTGVGSSPLNFTAIATNTSGVNWLTVTPAAGSTPGTLTVAANGSNLSQGTYVGTVTISSTGAAGSPLNIPVTLTVSSTPSISVTPATLTFSYQAGGTAPATQTVQIASSSGALPFTAAATTSGSSGNWLTVSPASGTTPGTLTIGVTPAGLTAGTYTGTVAVTAAGAGNSPQALAVTLVVTPASTPLPTTVTNAASGAPGPVSPGEIISIFGTNLGPTTGVIGTIANNLLSTQVGGVQVLFDNNPAPLLYVSATQINAIVPFALNGVFQTQMTVSNSGTVSTALDLVVAPTSPSLFTSTQTGTGQGAILNVNGSVNSSSNPAPADSIIVLYATGGGETSPAGVTGNITPADGPFKLVPGVTVTVGGVPATVLFAGTAPGFVEGALQINVQMSASVPPGPQPVVVTVGGVSSPAGVTVAVQ
jgi:uncharacterized protein (TIGR03437 family)